MDSAKNGQTKVGPRSVSFLKRFLKDKQVVLLLQGGGALGSYQVGAFEALAKACAAAGTKVRWVAGISIGAINAAVIAAPKHNDPVQELKSLWNEILSPDIPPWDYTGVLKSWFPRAPQLPWLAALGDRYSDWNWTAFNPRGQHNFFSSRIMNPFQNPWILQWFRKLDRDELAFYGTEWLAETLNRHVDWRKLADKEGTHLSLGATRVCDGEVEYFHSSNCYDLPSVDNALSSLHVRASAALPPAFPPIQVKQEWYLDGGVSNNTPIEILGKYLVKRLIQRNQPSQAFGADQPSRLVDAHKGIVVFLVDLWDRKNNILPASLEDLNWRQKCIQYGSRKKAAETVVQLYDYKARSVKHSVPHLDVCQIMLEQDDGDCVFTFSDADFSKSTFDRLYERGRTDMDNLLHYHLQHTGPVKHHGRPLGGNNAALYRHGSREKSQSARTLPHKHDESSRGEWPVVDAIKDYWQQFV